MHLYMQPVQDITVDDRVSRTQYQYTLEDPDFNELNEWTDKFVAELKKLPELEDVATDQQTGGRALQLDIDRVTASRLGIAPTTIDNTLYDAYGQRQISTLYTQTEPIPRGTGNAARIGSGIRPTWDRCTSRPTGRLARPGRARRRRSRRRHRLRRAPMR